MKNPMLFCTASADPTASGGLSLADIAENCGESATTKNPQTARSPNPSAGGRTGNTGANKHATAEPASATCATNRLPRTRLTRPPTTQPTAPAAITTNVPRYSGGPVIPSNPTRDGTRAQKAYNSHMCPK